MIVISDGVGNSFLKQMKVQGKRKIRYPLPIFVWENISRFFVLNVTKIFWRLDWINIQEIQFKLEIIFILSKIIRFAISYLLNHGLPLGMLIKGENTIISSLVFILLVVTVTHIDRLTFFALHMCAGFLSFLHNGLYQKFTLG